MFFPLVVLQTESSPGVSEAGWHGGDVGIVGRWIAVGGMGVGSPLTLSTGLSQLVAWREEAEFSLPRSSLIEFLLRAWTVTLGSLLCNICFLSCFGLEIDLAGTVLGLKLASIFLGNKSLSFPILKDNDEDFLIVDGSWDDSPRLTVAYEDFSITFSTSSSNIGELLLSPKTENLESSPGISLVN